MCVPAIIPALVMGATSAGLGIYQEHQQTKAANAAAKANIAAANRAYNIESAAQQAGVDEARVGVNQERTANLIRGTQAQGQALAAAGSSGVAGGALNSVLADYARQTGIANAELGQSLRFSGQNAELQRRGSFARTVEETTLANPRRKANYGGAILGGVNTGLSIYSSLR